MPRNFLTAPQKAQVKAAIEAAELRTSGEIQVHIEQRCHKPMMERAVEVFQILKMHRTAQRNGVLFYVAIEPHCFAIVGDEGINRVVEPGFWDAIRDHVVKRFGQQAYADGLAEGIHQVGEALRRYFPHQADDKNELSDDISFG